jgi:hypothetical protein
VEQRARRDAAPYESPAPSTICAWARRTARTLRPSVTVKPSPSVAGSTLTNAVRGVGSPAR